MLRARAVAFVAFEETKPLVLNEDLSVASEHSGDIAFNKLYGFIDPPPTVFIWMRRYNKAPQVGVPCNRNFASHS